MAIIISQSFNNINDDIAISIDIVQYKYGLSTSLFSGLNSKNMCMLVYKKLVSFQCTVQIKCQGKDLKDLVNIRIVAPPGIIVL